VGVAALVSRVSNSGGGPSTSGLDGSAGFPGSDASTGSDGSSFSFDGVYTATFTGTYQNTSPDTASGTTMSTATITVTSPTASEVELSWQVPPNPPSGDTIFLLDGAQGTLADTGAAATAQDAGGVIVGGACFTGIVNGNMQTNCCRSCTIAFSGNTFTQPNSGVYSGTNAKGIAYTGTYSGTWTGTIQ
jgi:hypothetical protein